MDIDDPRLTEARKEMFERVKKFDELMLAVMKSHTACEQFLNDLLSASGRKWKGRKCAGKINICRDELKLPDIEPAIWKVLEAGNKLRNKIAHAFDQEKIAARMSDLRKAYFAALTPGQAQGSEGLDDAGSPQGLLSYAVATS